MVRKHAYLGVKDCLLQWSEKRYSEAETVDVDQLDGEFPEVPRQLQTCDVVCPTHIACGERWVLPSKQRRRGERLGEELSACVGVARASVEERDELV